MTRQKWTTDEQHDWLESQKPAYIEANQKQMAAKDFFPKVMEDFFKKWPVEPVTPEEIANAKSVKFAERVKRRIIEKRVLNWFPNNSRTIGPSSAHRKVLKVTPKAQPKKLQAWQAYQSLFYESKWKPIVNKEWTEYKEKWETENSGEKATKGMRFTFMTNFIKTRYAEEPEDVKKRVEEYRNSRAERPEVPESDKRNLEYQKAINMLPRTLATIGKSLMAQTGWNITILAGGPAPNNSGAITTFLSHTGKTGDGETFEEHLGQKAYDTHLLLPFDEFLHVSFSSEDCAARCLIMDTLGIERSVEPEEKDQENGDDADLAGSGDEEKGEVGPEPERPKISEYELMKAKNIAELKEVVESFKTKFPDDMLSKKALKKPRAKSKSRKENEEPIVQRTLMRNKDDRPQPSLDTNANPGPAPPASEPPTSTESMMRLYAEKPALCTPAKTSKTDAFSILQSALAQSPLSTRQGISTPAVLQPEEKVSGDAKISTATLPFISKNSTMASPTFSALNAEPTTTYSFRKDASPPTGIPSIAPSALDAEPTAIDSSEIDTTPPAEPTAADLSEMDTTPPAEPPAADSSDMDTTPPARSSNAEPLSPPVPKDNIPCGKVNIGPANIVDSHGLASDIDCHSATAKSSSQQASDLPHQDIDIKGLPQWLTKMLDYLCNVSEDARWQDLLRNLVEFERTIPQYGNLPTKFRPQEVSDWIRSKKKDVVLSINSAAYGKGFMKWWLAMQPIWRKGDTGLVRMSPLGESWNVLKKGGTAGIYVVVMAVSWWIQATEVCDPAAWSAVDNLSWVLREFLKSGELEESPSVGEKRAREVENFPQAESRANKNRRHR